MMRVAICLTAGFLLLSFMFHELKKLDVRIDWLEIQLNLAAAEIERLDGIVKQPYKPEKPVQRSEYHI